MDNPASDGKQGTGDALRVVLVYAAVAVAWLLLSDHLLAFLVADPAQRVRLGFFKGVLFVAVTASILYGLVRGLQKRARAAERRELAHDVERVRTMRLLRAIADSSDAAVFAKDLEGRYLLLNRAAAAMLGKPARELIGSFDHMLLGPGQAAILREAGRAVIEQHREITTEESVALPGGTRTFTVTRGPLRNEQGDIIGLYGFARDVTAQQAADEEARRVADDLAATLRAIPDLLFELDGQGRYIRVATTAHNLLAVPEAQLMGRTVGDVLPAEAAHAVMEGIAAATRDGTDYGRTITLSLGGEVRHFEMSFARKGESHEAPMRFIVLSRDITQRVEAEEELKRGNEELRRFDSASIGRELRMVELKREVNALAVEAGREPPYDLAFASVRTPAES